MLKDLSEESLTTMLYKKISNFGLSKLKLKVVLKINQSLPLNIRVNLKNSALKKSLQWFSSK